MSQSASPYGDGKHTQSLSPEVLQVAQAVPVLQDVRQVASVDLEGMLLIEQVYDKPLSPPLPHVLHCDT